MNNLGLPLPPPASLVTEPGDTPEAAAELARRSAPGSNALVVMPTPSIRERFWIFRDLLSAMGARPDAHTTAREARVLEAQAIGRLAALPVRNLVVARANHMPARLLGDWIDAGEAAGKRVWLVAHVSLLNSALARVVEQRGLQLVGFEDLLREVPAPAAASCAKPPARPFPVVPRSEFPLFRASCRRLLEGRDLDRVEELFTSSLAEAATLIETTDADQEVLASHLREQVRASSTTDEVIVRTRATQVAAFAKGLHVKVRLEAVVGSSEWMPSAEITEEEVRRLGCLPHNHHAAAAVISWITGAGGESISRLNLSDVPPDASAVCIDGISYDVPAVASVLVAAQRYTRLLQGAGDRDPLFINSGRVGSARCARQTGKGVQRLLVTIAEASGLPLSAAWTSHEHNSAVNWANRTGVSVQSIPEAT